MLFAIGFCEFVEQAIGRAPQMRLGGFVRCGVSEPIEGFSSCFQRREARRQARARAEQLRALECVEIAAPRFRKLDPQGVHRFERSGKSPPALARTTSERRDATRHVGEQVQDQIGFAELNASEQERLRLDVVRIVWAHLTIPNGAAEGLDGDRIDGR
jgi:hypothetical protein